MTSDEVRFINEMLRAEPFAAMTLAQQRDAVEGAAGAPPPGTTFDAVVANGVACEWVMAPGAGPSPTILSLRGGGYCLGSTQSNRHFSSLLSQVTSGRLLNVGYRSAPEHRFPAALDDAIAAYRWVVRSGTSPSDVAIVGNSAGGGLTLAMLLALRDGGETLPGCAAVLSPWTDLAATGQSIATNAATEVMLDPTGIRATAHLYADDEQLTDPYVSPLYGDPTGLPPVLVHASRAEILLDDALRFAERARAHDVEVDLTLVDGMPHVWHLFAGYLTEADEALASLGGWITTKLPSGRAQN